MRIESLSSALVTAALLVYGAPAAGQPTAGGLAGTVTDAQGGVLPGAAVVVLHLPTGDSAETVTDAAGRYGFSGLRTGGPFKVSVSMIGFRLQERRDVAINPGETARADFELQLASVDEAVTVTAGTALARDDKRSARNIMDVVSADAVGRFPDANAAEALRRVPGVSFEVDQGEGRFVTVRGIDASLNNVTINGQIVGTPAEFGTRGVSMDSVPADLIARLEVVKAVRPDMDANAIGASINIATVTPFDTPGGFLFGSLRSGYNEMSGRAPFSGSVSFGRVLDKAQRWGVVIGGSYSRRHYESELFRASNVTWSQFNGFFVPQNQAFLLYDINRRRQGVNGALEFRPARGQSIALHVNHNLFKDTEGRQQTELDLTRGTLTNQTPTGGQFSQGRATREYRDYEQHHLINALQVVGTHASAQTTIDWNLGASRGERETPYRVDWEFRSAAGAFPNTYDVADPTLPRVTPSENFYQGSAYPFRRVRFREDLEREDVLSGALNVRKATAIGSRTGYWKAGAKVVARDKSQDRTNRNFNVGSPAFTLADFGLANSGPDDFFQGNFRFGPTLNLAALQQFFDQNPGRFAFDALTTQQNSLDQDFSASESVYAGYGMLGIDFTRWNLLAGVRVESTRGDYFANELQFTGGAFTGRALPATGEVDYTDILPGLHVNFFPRSQFTIRAAWTNTLGRPAYADLAPISVLDEIQDTDGSWVGSLSTGNAGLKPFESTNFDLSFEYHLPSGLISVAPFYKRIDNPIYDRSIVEQNVVHNGRTFARFGFARPENAEHGHIAGIEFAYQNAFTRLPSPFDGLGANINYTWTDSSVTVFGRTGDDLPFFQQSNHVGNVAVLYRKYGVEGQLAVSFQSAALGSIGTDPASDNYSDFYMPVDAKVSVPVSRRFRAFVELRNLTDEPRRRFAGVSDRRVHHEIYARDVYAGLDWRWQ